MAETNATILIPDISGFTEFVTNTELEHGSFAINSLLDTIIKATENEYEVSEIEGDAVLMYRRGPAPGKKEILETCLRIFRAFHYNRMWMQQHSVCPCGTCQAIVNLTLKFVVHHGPVGEMKVGRFVTLSGRDIIVAHRLLKNSVPSNEYLLLTEKLYEQFPDRQEPFELEWHDSSDEFSSLGKVGYRFARLEKVRQTAPEPPSPEFTYSPDDTPYLEKTLASDYRSAYMVLMNIPGRAEWMPGLIKVEQEAPEVYVGSTHQCQFENYRATVSPLLMNLSDEAILYAEKFISPDLNISLVYEYLFKNLDENNCQAGFRYLNISEKAVPEEINQLLLSQMKKMADTFQDQFKTIPRQSPKPS